MTPGQIKQLRDLIEEAKIWADDREKIIKAKGYFSNAYNANAYDGSKIAKKLAEIVK